MKNTDPLYKSWRVYAFAFSLLSFWAQSSALLDKIYPLMVDGLSPTEALELLDQAGPMLQSADQVFGMIASAVAAGAIFVSKIRSWDRQTREQAAIDYGDQE